MAKEQVVDKVPVWRFHHASGDTIGHAQSGMQSTFSPSGRYLGIRYNSRWGILDLHTGRCSDAFQKTISGASIGYLIWTPDEALVSYHKGKVLKIEAMTGKQLASTGISTVNAAWSGHALDYQSWYTAISVPGPYFALQHTAGYDGQNLQRRWISIFEVKAWKELHHYAFDKKVHKGISKQDRWHELVFDAPNQTLLASLSAFGPSTNADHSFRMDGTGWKAISSQKRKRGSVCDDFWTHPTYYHGKVAYGVWQGSTPMMAFGSYDGCGAHTYVPVHGVGKHSWHHGYMTQEYIIVAAIEHQTTKKESYLKLYHLPSKKYITTLLLNHATPSFLTTARPFVSEKGRFCWHSSRYSSTGKVDLLCSR